MLADWLSTTLFLRPELAERAEINKGTFYLHSRDIYDLYRQLVAETAGKTADRFDPYPDLFEAPELSLCTFFGFIIYESPRLRNTFPPWRGRKKTELF